MIYMFQSVQVFPDQHITLWHRLAITVPSFLNGHIWCTHRHVEGLDCCTCVEIMVVMFSKGQWVSSGSHRTTGP
jgi:hypothetical protein